MPRWASRLTLEITDVRVQRLQEISFDDCLAEGVVGSEFWPLKGEFDMSQAPEDPEAAIDYGWEQYTRTVYRDLWESINGKGSWDANPWVWAITFNVTH
jgi:hypothetical protein